MIGHDDQARKEAIGLALDSREIAFCVFVTAAPLKQFLDRLSIGERGLVDLDPREVPAKAFFFDPRALSFSSPASRNRRAPLAGPAPCRAQETGRSPKDSSACLRLPNPVEERRCALSRLRRAAPCRQPDARRAAVPALAELFDVLVEL